MFDDFDASSSNSSSNSRDSGTAGAGEEGDEGGGKGEGEGAGRVQSPWQPGVRTLLENKAAILEYILHNPALQKL